MSSKSAILRRRFIPPWRSGPILLHHRKSAHSIKVAILKSRHMEFYSTRVPLVILTDFHNVLVGYHLIRKSVQITVSISHLGFLHELNPWFKNRRRSLENKTRTSSFSGPFFHTVYNYPGLLSFAENKCTPHVRQVNCFSKLGLLFY